MYIITRPIWLLVALVYLICACLTFSNYKETMYTVKLMTDYHGDMYCFRVECYISFIIWGFVVGNFFIIKGIFCLNLGQ